LAPDTLVTQAIAAAEASAPLEGAEVSHIRVGRQLAMYEIARAVV
jgi:hypothetical protein